MGKRIAAGLLWFLAVSALYGFVDSLTGLPDQGAYVVGALAAALVFMDPTGSLWERRAAR